MREGLSKRLNRVLGPLQRRHGPPEEGVSGGEIRSALQHLPREIGRACEILLVEGRAGIFIATVGASIAGCADSSSDGTSASGMRQTHATVSTACRQAEIRDPASYILNPWHCVPPTS